jgi:hypothetical protein
MTLGVQGGHLELTRERRLAGQAVVEHASEGAHVGPVIHALRRTHSRLQTSGEGKKTRVWFSWGSARKRQSSRIMSEAQVQR